MALYDEARADFSQQIDGVKQEEDLENVLSAIAAFAADELGPLRAQMLSETDAREALIAVEAWASLASYACARYYVDGPTEVGTRWRSLGGMSQGVVSRLQDLAERFGEVLREACRLLGAASFSVSIGFPLGVSIGLSW